MANWEYYPEHRMPEPVPPPETYEEIVLKKPFGKGTYKLKCIVIKISRQTTVVEAYSRLVRIGSADGIHWRVINVKSYIRKVPTHYIKSSNLLPME